MPRGRWSSIAEISANQAGLITRSQLIERGIGGRAVSRRIDEGLLEVIQPAVYLVAGAPKTWEQSLLAALLGSGEPSYISHLAAAKVWELEGIDPDRPHILVPHERRLKLRRVIVHRTRVLASDDVRGRNGLRITTPARTLVDIAGIIGVDELERALDDGLRRRIVTLKQIRACLDRRGPNGVRGWARIDRLVEERVGTEPTGSGKETTFLRGLRERGLPVPVKQFRILDANGKLIARPDFSYPDIKLAVEIDSGFHTNPRARERDLRRQNAMTVAGWRCLYFDRVDPAGQAEAFDIIECAFGERRGTRGSLELPRTGK